MVNSAKSRSKNVFEADTQIGSNSNDNNPGMHPGHELSDLRNVPRQPAAEAVIHYTRFAEIKSFPDHPQMLPAAHAAAPPMDADVEKQADGKAPVKRWVTFACLGSAIFHTAVLALVIALVAPSQEEPVEDAGSTVSVIILGDSDQDQAAMGEETQDEPEPEEVVAERVEPETVQPTEVEPEQVQPATAEPLEDEAMPPTQEVTRVSPETVTAAEPEVLVSQGPAETFVVQPMATVVPEEVTPDVTVAETQPTEVQPTTAVVPEEVKPVETIEAAEALPDPLPPEEVAKPTPKPKQRAEKPKPAEKKAEPPKKVRTASGSQGESKQNSRKGFADGAEAAQSDRNSRNAGNSDGDGTAAFTRYKGRVEARINRCVQRLSREYRKGGGSLRVKFVIIQSGAVTAMSVLSSSGASERDRAVVDLIRNCSIPPIPADVNESTLPFDQVVQISDR